MFDFEQYREITNRLAQEYERQEASAMARWIVEERPPQSPCLGGGEELTQEEVIRRLLRHEPLQYIFGYTEWRGLRLKVTPATLIPRPETAELVEAIGEYVNREQRDTWRVLDVGTGSGCIAIALKKEHPDWHVCACDINKEALEVARKNADENGVFVHFYQVDILHDELPGTFDLIVSNPPYICEEERATMEANVLEYEPETALFVPDNDPLLFYRRIAELGKMNHEKLERLEKDEVRDGVRDVMLAFEINERFGKETCEMLREMGYGDIQLIQDICGKDRIVLARS